MGRRALVGTVATLGLVALVGLFAALSLLFSSPIPAYAQGTNSEPTFTEGAPATREVAENSPAYHDIGLAVSATDADTDDRLTYSIQNARTSPFTIVRSTGQLQVGQPLDHEDEDEYTVVVLVTDSEDDNGDFENPAVIDDTITITITVNNVEEDESVSLSWKQPQVNTPITASLTELDGINSGPTWQWASSNSQSGTYNDLTDNGATSATYTPQSVDANKWLRATASYTDGQSASKTPEAVSYREVRTAPAGNEPPAFGSEFGTYGCSETTAKVCRHISRSTPVGKDIYYPVRATDSDGDEIRYSLSDTDPNSGDAASFRIDSSRGTLYTTNTQPYDDYTYKITIKATDPSEDSGSLTVELKLSGGEGSPVVNGPSSITYPENGTWALATYTATAANEGGGTRPIEGWIIGVEPGGGDGDFFDIDDDGNLTFTQPPDYENPADENGDRTYSFMLHVYDTQHSGTGNPAQTFFNVTVTVTDEKVEALEISGPSAVSYAENREDAVATYTLQTSQGASASTEWVLSGADGDQFSISAGGELTFNSQPDFENPTDSANENAYLVTITAHSESDSKTEFVRVRVTNANEPPEFDEGETATRSVNGDAEVTDLVGDPVSAIDPDKSAALTYTLKDANLLPFRILDYSGQLLVDDALDQNSYTLSVSVTDGQDADGNPDTTADATILVTVNVDGAGSNTDPEFPAAAVTFSFDENTTTVQTVGTPVTATDDDTLAYTLGGTDAGFFTIVDTSGQIQTKAGQTYDFETKPTYSVTVTANDGNGGTADKPVTITLNNLEEAGTVTLAPTQPAARSPVNATLTDPDGSISSTSWQWQSSSDGSTGWANVGTHSASYTPPDADVDYYLRATASYTDGAGGSKTATGTTTQKVQTGTNRPPTFDDGQDTIREVAEDAAANANVGDEVEASDLDNDDLAYSLTGQDAGLFTIETGTGQVKVKTGTTLDYEGTRNSYTVVVKVTDSKNAAGVTEQTATTDDTIIVTINVTNVDEDGTVSLSMTQPSARTQLTATLTDPDGGVTSESWQWAKADAKAGPYTDIGGQTSASYTPPDGDVGKFLKATASYTDGHGPNKSAEKETTQAVGAGANRPPTFSGPSATREVAENPTEVANVGAPVTATDPDTGNTPAYTLDTTGATLFDIDSASGQIKTKSGVTYDHETTPSYSVTVTADDKKGGTDTITVTITLTNVDEDGTVILSTNQPTARAQVTATLTDPDGGVTGTSWQWERSSDGNTGWTNVGTISPSYTTVDGDVGYYLRATASYTDGHGANKSANEQTTQPVGAGTNRVPEFGLTSTTRDVAENTPADQPFGAVVEATDPDTGDTLTYSLSGADSSLFDIDTGTGQVKVKTGTMLDYEGTRKSYTVLVEVTDGKNADESANPAMDDSIAVTINVTDVDEDGTVNLSMTHPSARSPITATLVDPDIGVTGESWQWAKASTAQGTYTDIATATSAIYTPADEDVSEFLRATVSYEDDHDQNQTAEAVSANAVQAGANRAPTFAAGAVTLTVPENSAADVNVGSPITANDPDTSNTLIYSLEGTDKDAFKIVSDNGQIQTKQGVTYDYETKQTYSVTVKADDGNSGTATKAVTINVTDAEDAGTVTLSTSQPVARTQLTATLSDQDGPVTSTTWVWERMLDPDDLTTHPWATITGATTDSYTPIDGDVNYYLRATATYTDSHEPNKTAAAVSANAVQSGVNRAPAFSAATATREFPENTGSGLKVDIPVGATDVDANDVLEYTLEGTDKDFFEIVPTNGQIKTKERVTYDHEAKDSYSVIVKADDKKGGTDTIDVTINVTDVNEKPAFTATPPVTFSIAENTLPHTNVGAPITATDPDNGDTLTYSLSGTDADSFNINTSTGQLQTKAAPDFEDKPEYYLTVWVRDSRGDDGTADTTNDASIPVIISVTDVNEPPAFPSTETGRRNVDENSSPGSTIGVPVGAIDPEGDSLTYTLDRDDEELLSIDVATGQIRMADGVTLDYETTPSYTVIVSVSDSKDARGNPDTITDDEVTVTITVTDGDEPPVLTGQAAVSYPENSDGPVHTYTATDPERATIKWSLTGDDVSDFSFEGGVLAFDRSPDYETPTDTGTNNQYSVTVVASDGPNPVERAVTVTVTNVNEPPDFDSETATRTVPENTLADQPVGAVVSAVDPDNGVQSDLQPGRHGFRIVRH